MHVYLADVEEEEPLCLVIISYRVYVFRCLGQGELCPTIQYIYQYVTPDTSPPSPLHLEAGSLGRLAEL